MKKEKFILNNDEIPQIEIPEWVEIGTRYIFKNHKYKNSILIIPNTIKEFSLTILKKELNLNKNKDTP